jgi:type IV secretory pathway component VirB8
MFISDWNDNPKNRDKTYIVFRELQETKEKIVENLNDLLERDRLIETNQVKANKLQSSAKLYKKNATKVRKGFRNRRILIWVSVITGLALLIAGIILILVFWLKVF